MSVINLNKLRKAKARTKDRAEADANAIRFGRSKAEKQLVQANAEKTARDLDGAKRDPD